MVEWLNNIFSCLLVLLNPSMRFSVSIVACDAYRPSPWRNKQRCEGHA
jgi:hypothetical protein